MLLTIFGLLAVVIVGAIGLHEADWWIAEARRRMRAGRRKGQLL